MKQIVLKILHKQFILYTFLFIFQDINNAQLNNYPEHLYQKLTTRKNKAENLLSKQLKNDYHEKIPEIESDRNPSIDCAKNCVEIKNNSEFGRHVIATRKINIGEVIAVEKPFTAILLKDDYLTHCYHCLKFTYNLIPCKTCVHVGYCSELCRENSWNSHHKHECDIIDYLIERQFDKLTVVALKIVIITKEIKSEGFKLENDLYKSENYEEIFNLITNHELRQPRELLRRCLIVATIFHLFKHHTHYFNGENEERTFKTLLLKHWEAASSNFHEISELIGTKNGTYEKMEIGVGAYSFLSLLNHSCRPNVVRHCYGNSIILRALTPIEKDEQLLDNYGYVCIRHNSKFEVVFLF